MSAVGPPATTAVPYLLAGPSWTGEKPEGIKEVIKSDTDFALVAYRTQLLGPDDLENVKKIQAGYKAEPLSTFLKEPTRRRRRRRSTGPRR